MQVKLRPTIGTTRPKSDRSAEAPLGQTNMDTLLRKSWFRLILVTAAVVAVAAFYPFAEVDRLREGMAKVLQSATLLFTVCSAISLAVFNNYVKGLKDAALKRITDVRGIIEKLYDEFHDAEDEDLQEIVNCYLLPLLSLPTPQWLDFEPLKPILERIVEPLTRLHERNPTIAPRYFLRLEDEINELGILYIRRIVSDLHTRTIVGAFQFVCVGIISICIVAILPISFTLNFIAIATATAITALAILELLLLLSYIKQEAREELPNDSDDTDDIVDIRESGESKHRVEDQNIGVSP